MPGFAAYKVVKGVMARSLFAGGGGGGGSGAPAMPAAATGPWVRQADTVFPIDVTIGNFANAASGYMGNPSADDRGKMQFGYYPYPSYTDTRSKQHKTITITTVNGSAAITSSGAFTAANYVYGGTAALGGSYIAKTGTTPFSANTRILSVSNTSNAVLTAPAIASGTWSVTTTPDFGHYDESRYSVKDGILTLKIDSTADGIHHVGALRPKLNNGTGIWSVTGGKFTVCMRVPTAIPGYKIASLLYRSQTLGGEIDFPEQDFDGGLFAGMFVHFDNNSGTFAQRVSTTDIVGSSWHVYSFEWRPFGGPGGTDPTLSTCACFIDGVQVGPTATGINVPNKPMHWIWQIESNLKYAEAIDETVTGTVQWAWATFDNMA